MGPANHTTRQFMEAPMNSGNGAQMGPAESDSDSRFLRLAAAAQRSVPALLELLDAMALGEVPENPVPVSVRRLKAGESPFSRGRFGTRALYCSRRQLQRPWCQPGGACEGVGFQRSGGVARPGCHCARPAPQSDPGIERIERICRSFERLLTSSTAAATAVRSATDDAGRNSRSPGTRATTQWSRAGGCLRDTV